MGLLPMNAQKHVSANVTPPKSEVTAVKQFKASELSEVALNSDKRELDNLLKEYSYTEEYHGEKPYLYPSKSPVHLKMEYDGYGRIKSIDYGDHKCLYSYVDGADGEWVERVISEERDGTATPATKEVRTFGSDGKLLTKDSYTYDATNQSWTKTKSLVWFAPTQTYLESSSNYSTQTEIEVDGNSYVATVKQYDYNSGWYVSRKEKHAYTSDGVETLNESYDYAQDGTIQGGNKSEKMPNQPQEGYVTDISYNYQDNAWVASTKEIYTSNYHDPYINDGKHREWTRYSFDSTNNEWKVEDWKKQDWGKLSNWNLLLQDGKDDEGDKGPYIYDDQGNPVKNVMPFGWYKSGDSHVLGYYINYHDDDDRYFSFYDVNGNETRKIHQKSGEDANWSNLSYNVLWGNLSYEEYKDGTWQPLASADITIGEYHFKTNEKGQATYYEDDELYKIFTYTADGIHFERYDHDGGDNDDQTYKSEDYTLTKDKDGVITVIEKWYDYGNPVATDMEKWIIYPNGKQFHGEYFSENDDTPYSGGWSVSDLTSTDDKGITTAIHRSLENDEIVETGKTVSYMNGDTSWKEEYTKTDGEWVPQTKTENGKDGIVSWTINYVGKDGAWVPQTKTETSYPAKPEFECIQPTDPLAALGLASSSVDNEGNWWQKSDDNANAASVTSSTIAKKSPSRALSSTEIVDTSSECTKSYTWDEASGSWVLDEKNSKIFEYTVDDASYQMTTQFYVRDSYNEAHNGLAKIVAGMKRDDRHRMVESTTSTQQPGYDDDVINQYTYEYAGDNLVKATRTQSCGKESLVECNTYAYGKATTDGIASISNAFKTIKLHMVGKTIYADSSKSLALYAADGKLVAKGQNGQVTAPASGIYIVLADGVKVKVAIQ